MQACGDEGTATPSLAIVHDYLTQRGGAERVVLAMHRTFPDAPIHTSLYEHEATFPEFQRASVTTAPIDRVPSFRRNHRLALPVLAPTFSRMHIDADVVLCSSSGWAHGVQTDGRKVIYCYAPARWLYQTSTYLSESGRLTATALRAAKPALIRWDRKVARSGDRYFAISTRSQELIREAWGIDAEILHPPSGVDGCGDRTPVPGVEPGYFLCVSRLLPYKNVDVVLRAIGALPTERVVIVGKGPDEERLRSLAPTNATFLQGVADAELRWLYANARAVIGASFEDYGLTPLEGAAFGVPAVVLRFGGYLDTVVEDETGVFFDDPSPAKLIDAIRRLDLLPARPDNLRAHADQFNEERFQQRLREAVT